MLLRNMVFMEVDEDDDPTILLAPGVPAHWYGDDDKLLVTNAPTIFGGPLSFALAISRTKRTITIRIEPHAFRARFVLRSLFGPIRSAKFNGTSIPFAGDTALIPPGSGTVQMTYG